MKTIAPLLVIFALLTQPNGKTIWIARDEVVAIMEPTPYECSDDTHAVVLTQSARFCVAEDPATVARLLK